MVLFTQRDFPSGATPMPWDGVPSRSSALPKPAWGVQAKQYEQPLLRLAKSTTAKPFKPESWIKIRRVEPSGFRLEGHRPDAPGRT